MNRDEFNPQDDGAAVLDEVEALLRQFVVFPCEENLVAVVLWIAHTHAIEVIDNTPRLAFLSPEPSSGKSRALEICELLVARPLMTINATPAYLIRRLAQEEGHPPTLLYDEIDTVFGPLAYGNNEAVRGLINAGYRRGATSGRCVPRGNVIETEDFPAFAPVAMAGLHDLPDTIMSRSIVIRMRRKTESEHVEPYRPRIHKEAALGLRERLSAWVISIHPVLEQAWPELPPSAQDRNADMWEPLIAIADAAGGDWPSRARAAAVSHVSRSGENEGSVGVQLLANLRVIFDDHLTLSTRNILELLNSDGDDSESSWGDFKTRGLTATTLAKLLKPYGVRPKQVRVGTDTLKGYHRNDFADAWNRYLPKEEGNAPESSPLQELEAMAEHQPITKTPQTIKVKAPDLDAAAISTMDQDSTDIPMLSDDGTRETKPRITITKSKHQPGSTLPLNDEDTRLTNKTASTGTEDEAPRSIFPIKLIKSNPSSPS